MQTLQEKLNLYHDAIQKAQEMGLMVPDVVQLADFMIFPPQRKEEAHV